MNEKIKELAEQAGFHVDIPPFLGDSNNPRLQQFAELIVAECVEQIKLTMARDGHSTEHYKQSSKHIEKIKEQFGVEE